MFDLRVEMAEQTYLTFVAEPDHIALRQFLGRLHQRLPTRTIYPLDQRRLDLRLGGLPDAAAFELSGYYLGVVDHQLVARVEPLRKIANMAVAQYAIGRHHQHARRITRMCRTKRNAVRRKFEIEEVGAHGADALQRFRLSVRPLRNKKF